MNNKKPLLASLFIAIFVPTILLCLSVSFGITNTYKQYHTMKNEIHGLHAIQKIFSAMVNLERMRGLAQIQINTHSEEIENQIAYGLNGVNYSLSNTQNRNLASYFKINNDIDNILERIEALYSKTTVIGEVELFKNYTSIIDDLYLLILKVSERSDLILDDNLETYYLMDIVVHKIPESIESIAKIRGLGASYISKEIINRREGDAIIGLIAIADYNLSKFNLFDAYSSSVFSDIRSAISSEINAFNKKIKEIINKCDDYPCAISSEDNAKLFFENATQIIDKLGIIFIATTNQLESKLEKRASSYMGQIVFTICLTVICVFFISLLSVLHYKKQTRVYSELKHVSVTDELTNMPSRQLLEPLFNKEVNNEKMSSKGFIFGIIDIDNFKKYNDTYGYRRGDDVLRKTGRTLSALLQGDSDYCFRYGGEEFCFFINIESSNKAVETIEKIRKSIMDLGLQHKTNQPYGIVTVSIGAIFISDIKKINFDLDSCIKNAEMMLYSAKSSGRNRCKYKYIESEDDLDIDLLPS